MRRRFSYVLVGCSALGLAIAIAAAGCISDPTQPEEVMCESSSDCNSGETCDEGICYGNPPVGELVAVLNPSGEAGTELVQTIIHDLSITPDGVLEDLVFQSPVRIEGKVTLVCSQISTDLGLPCGPDAPIDASIRVERAPAFPGGPRFSQTFIAKSAVADGASSFTLVLPPTSPDPDGAVRNYQVTVTPAVATDGSTLGAAAIAPPRIEFDFSADVDGQVEWKLGEPDQTKWVSGCIVSGAQSVPSYAKGLPVAGYALDLQAGTGGTEELVLVTSRGRTDNAGCFSVRAPTELATINFRFEPDGDGPTPRIEVVDEPIDGSLVAAGACYGGSPSDAVCLPDLVGPNLTNPEEITLPITAQASEGGASPVANATVRMVAALPFPEEGGNPTRQNPVSASIEIRAISSANNNPGQLGQATMMAPVNLNYVMSVVPGTDSKFAARIAEERRIDRGGVQEPIYLARRVGVSGTLVSADGEPVVGARVAATPNVLFKFSQPNNVRAVLDSLASSTTTRDDGSFFFWLEGGLNLSADTVGEEVVYDLAILPPYLKGPPTRINNIAPGTEGLDLGEVRLPVASRARGPVLDHEANRATSVAVDIWFPTDEDPCATFSLPDGQCPAAATLIGTWPSDEDGIVRIVLPNPL